MEISNPRTIKYPPTELPFATYLSLSSNTEGQVFAVSDLGAKIVRTGGVSIQSLADVHLEFDVSGPQESVSKSLRADCLQGIDELNELELLTTSGEFKYTVSNRSTTDYTPSGSGAIRTWGTLFYEKPTIVQKLMYGMDLNNDEQKIAEKYDLKEKVKYGLVPIRPVEVSASEESRDVLEEGYVTGVETAPSKAKTVMNLSSTRDQVIFLTGISADGATGTVSDGIQWEIIRDSESVATLDNYGLPSIDTEVSCFVPALNNIKIKLSGSGNNAPKYRFRYLKTHYSVLDKARWEPISAVTQTQRQGYKLLKEQLKAGVKPELTFKKQPQG